MRAEGVVRGDLSSLDCLEKKLNVFMSVIRQATCLPTSRPSMASDRLHHRDNGTLDHLERIVKQSLREINRVAH